MIGFIAGIYLIERPKSLSQFGTSIFLRTTFLSAAYLTMLNIVYVVKKEAILRTLAENVMNGRNLINDTLLKQHKNNLLSKACSWKGIGYVITGIFALTVVGTTIQTMSNSSNKK